MVDYNRNSLGLTPYMADLLGLRDLEISRDMPPSELELTTARAATITAVTRAQLVSDMAEAWQPPEADYLLDETPGSICD